MQEVRAPVLLGVSMSLKELADFIKDVGFPIFITLYLLFVHDKILREIRQEVKRLNLKG